MSQNPLPDRLAIDPDSPFHDEALLAKGIGIRPGSHGTDAITAAVLAALEEHA